MAERKVVVNLASSGAVSGVHFIGGHLSKRELQRVLKAVEREHRQKIREYRRIQAVEQAKKELKDANRRSES